MNDVGAIAPSRVAVVEGTGMLEGVRSGQIKVTISPSVGFTPETDQTSPPAARTRAMPAATSHSLFGRKVAGDAGGEQRELVGDRPHRQHL